MNFEEWHISRFNEWPRSNQGVSSVMGINTRAAYLGFHEVGQIFAGP